MARDKVANVSMLVLAMPDSTVTLITTNTRDKIF